MNIFKAIKKIKLKNFKSRKALIIFIGLFLFFVFSLPILKNQEKQKDLKLSSTFPTNSYLYQSKSNGFTVYLGNRQEKDLPQVKFTSLGASIDFKPLNSGKANLAKIENENSIVYQEILPGIDISYSLTPKGVKEEIIIKTQAARERIIQNDSLLFEATVDKAILNKNQSFQKGISFTDLGGKNPLFYIPQPFMIDSQGEKSEKIKIEFVPQSNNNQNQQSKFTVKMTPDSEWLKKASLPIIIDPTVEISIINVQSYPRTGDNWEVSFNTQGKSHLTITPDSQNSIDDLEFVSLSCGSQILNPQILEKDVVFYPDWECHQEGKIVHKVKHARNHILKFQFGEQTAFAYNAGPPLAPTSLQTEGQTNPTNVGEGTPEFSAVYNDPDESDIANKYWVQVDDDSNFSSPVWDSGSSGTAMTNCNEGERCQEISYGGSGLVKDTTYYWRIKFWDDEGGEGEWSNINVLDTSLDLQPADESGFLQEDLAYNTSMIPSGTAGIVTLTLGSGNWNDNSKVKSGARVTGNGGVATIMEVPYYEGTIQAKVETNFNDTSEITAGDWHLYATKFNSLEELVLNDFSGRKNLDIPSDTGPIGNYNAIASVQIDTDKVLIIFEDTDNASMWTGIVASVSETTVTYGEEALVSVLSYNGNFNEQSAENISITKIDTNKALIVLPIGRNGNDAAIVALVSGTTVTFGPEYNFNDGEWALEPNVTSIGTNKALIVYGDDDNSQRGTAVVATVSGTSISFGSEAVYENDGSTQYNTVTQLDTDKALITYKDPSSDGAIARVASVSGTTITYGTEASVVANISYNSAPAIKLDTDKALVTYPDNGDSSHGKAKVASVSGTTISWGDEAEFLAGTISYDISLASLGTDKALIAYSGRYAKVASISGTTITYGSPATVSPSSYNLFVAKLDTDKIIASYGDGSGNNYAYSKVLTISETTITVDSEYLFNDSGYRIGDWWGGEVTAIQIDTNKILIAYQDTSNKYGKVIVASVSGTTITYGEETTFSSSGTPYSISLLKLNTDKALIAYGNYVPYQIDGYAIVASVSGTTISLGDAAQFATEIDWDSGASRIDTDKALVAYTHLGGNGYAKVATISGTTITYGDESTAFATDSQYVHTSALSTDKALVVYTDESYNNQGIVASVSGTTISWGSTAATGGSNYETFADQIDTDKAILVSDDTAIVASVSGTTITYGSEESLPYDTESDSIRVASIGVNKAIITYSRYNQRYQGMAVIVTVSGTTITAGSEYKFNEAFTDFCQPAKIDTDKALLVYNRFATNQDKATEGYGTAVATDINEMEITSFYGQLHYNPGDYFTVTTSDINQTNVTNWLDINSITVSETLNSQTINYGVSFDDRTTWKIYDTTGGDTGWRPIARDNSGTWEYNANTTAGATDITWTSASTNTQFGALDQAFQITANQMTGTEFNAMTDTQFEESGGFDSSSSTVMDFAFGLKTTSEIVTPQLSGIIIDYDNNPDYFAVADQVQLKGLNLSGITIE